MKVTHPLPGIAEDKNEWSYTSSTAYDSMAYIRIAPPFTALVQAENFNFRETLIRLLFFNTLRAGDADLRF